MKCTQLFIIHEERDDLFFQAVEVGETYQLFQPKSNPLSLTQLGYEVIEMGGFEQWRKKNKMRDEETHQATVSSSESSKSAARASWASATFAALEILLSIYQFIDAKENKKEIDEMHSTIKLLTQQTRMQSNNLIKSQFLLDSLLTKARNNLI